MTRPEAAGVPRAPEVLLIGRHAAVAGAAAVDAYRLLRAAIQRESAGAGGLRPPTRVQAYLDALREAAELAELEAQAHAGTAEPLRGRDRPGFEDEIDVEEARSLLEDCSSEYVRRLVRQGRIRGRKERGGRWRVSKADVIAHQKERAA